MNNDFGWLLLLLGGLLAFKSIANNPKLPQNIRFVARYIEDDLYQDLVSGEFFYA